MTASEKREQISWWTESLERPEAPIANRNDITCSSISIECRNDGLDVLDPTVLTPPCHFLINNARPRRGRAYLSATFSLDETRRFDREKGESNRERLWVWYTSDTWSTALNVTDHREVSILGVGDLASGLRHPTLARWCRWKLAL